MLVKKPPCRIIISRYQASKKLWKPASLVFVVTKIVTPSGQLPDAPSWAPADWLKLAPANDFNTPWNELNGVNLMCLQNKATLLKATFVLLCTGALLGTLSASAGEQALIWNADDENLQWGPCPEFMPEGCGIAVLQGDPIDHNADVFFRLPGGTTAPHHWHTSAERMVLVSGIMEVHYDEQEPVILRPGTYAYGPPELPHVTHCRSDEDCVLFIAFEEPVDAIATE